MGINPKIGITGLPRSGKSAVLQKVIDMVTEEGGGLRRLRGPMPPEHIIGGMRVEAVIEDGERVGYACVNILTGEKGVMPIEEATPDIGFSASESTLVKSTGSVFRPFSTASVIAKS